MGDGLVALVQHMYTEEEAEVLRHLKPWRARKAASIAGASGIPLDEVEAVLHTLAHEKYVIGSYGQGDTERFALLPIVPGAFESALIRISPDSVTPWHRRFAELYEELVATGYHLDYFKKPLNAVRYLPVGESIQNEAMAYPSDRLEAILERYKDFAVGVCQCRLSKQLTGGGCGRMLETCTVMGDLAPLMVEQGRMRAASMKEVLEIKGAAEKEGLVTWMMNEDSGKFTNASCSCCGCCCGALRTITEFNSPGFIARPHFMPMVEGADCTLCGKCSAVCPMKAFILEGEGEEKRLVHRRERCIGCGLCAVACPKASLAMRPAPGSRKTPGGWPSYLARYAPRYLRNALRVSLLRRW